MTQRGTPRPLAFAPANVDVAPHRDGGYVLSSPLPPAPAARQIGVWLREWAERAPDRVFLAERRARGAQPTFSSAAAPATVPATAPAALAASTGALGDWFEVSYADARRQVDRLAAQLLQRDLGPERPVAILSDNSVDAALLALAAMQVGIPVAPISPAYSLLARDLGKLRHCLELLTPGLVFAADGDTFSRALASVPAGTPTLVSTGGANVRAERLEDWLARPDDGANAGVEAAFARTGPDTIAKFLFTSGSTGVPKAVVNTHGMLCANQAAIRQVWTFLAQCPPTIVDWLPWSHTFGGNHNFHMVLANGGSLYIDGGKPAPHLIATTAANLRAVPPTLYFNVPRGFGLLLPLLETDRTLAARFFERLDLIFYAGAALPQDLWERVEALCLRETGRVLPMVSAWGSTETSPLVTSVHFPIPRAGVIGLPVPGMRLKLVPSGAKLELRVAGPCVTPGYWRQPELTSEAFDDEGYYKIGDAGAFADPADPSKGIVFDGRVAEDFKLSSGTWINAGRLRVEAIANSGGLLADAVVCGHDRDDVRLLGIPDWNRVNTLATDLGPDASPSAKLTHPCVAAALAEAFAHFNQTRERASERITAVRLLAEPPSIDAGEITDKGYLNQAALRTNRADDVRALYASQ